MLKLFNNGKPTENNKNEARWFCIYLATSALFLFLTSLQGISFHDIGFYLSGYQHFNGDPYASYFLAQWYLTFRFLSLVCNDLGIDTFLGIRLLRIVFMILLQTIVYLYLRKFIKPKYIITGLALSMLAQYGAYSELNYNDLSIFILICALILYHKALTLNQNRSTLNTKRSTKLPKFAQPSTLNAQPKYPQPSTKLPKFAQPSTLNPQPKYTKRSTLIVLSGILIGISFFLRLVNLTFISLPFFALFLCYYYKVKVSWWRQLVQFFLGVAIGCILILGIAWADGTLGVLQLTFDDLAAISVDKDDYHNFRVIIRFYLYDVLAEVKMALFIAFVIYGYILARMQASNSLIHLAYTLLGAAIVIVVWRDGIAGNITVGFCLAVFLLNLFTQHFAKKGSSRFITAPPIEDKRVSLLFAFAMFIPVVFPFGSNGTNQFYGQMVCFLALPIAVSVIMRGSDNPSFHTGRLAAIYIIAAIGIGMTATNIFRPMMEDGNRLECQYKIDSHATRHLLTNKDNADLHNRMVSEVKPLIPRGSHLICNFSITMISVLDCKPYAIFADSYSTPSRAERYLKAAYEKSKDGKQLPYLLIDEERENSTLLRIREVLAAYSPYEEAWRSGSIVLLRPKTAE